MWFDARVAYRGFFPHVSGPTNVWVKRNISTYEEAAAKVQEFLDDTEIAVISWAIFEKKIVAQG